MATKMSSQLGMSVDMDATDRAPARVQYMTGDFVEDCVRNAFSTPYSASQSQEEDEDTDVYEPEHNFQEEMHEPVAEVEKEPSIYVSEPAVPMSDRLWTSQP